MKKFFTSFILCVLTVCALTLSACGGNDGGTYYPTCDEMKVNLERHGYSVDVTTDLGGKNGTQLSATKDDEYLVFYWLTDSEDCDYFSSLLENKYADYHTLVSLENDEKFGSLVYCGTENAVNAAGIRVVKVKV